MATPPISRSVAAKPHNVKRCSLAAEAKDPGNPCQLRGTIAHEVASMEARVQNLGNCCRHCHLEPTPDSAVFVHKMSFKAPLASRCAVHRVFGVTGAGGNKTHDKHDQAFRKAATVKVHRQLLFHRVNSSLTISLPCSILPRAFS